MPNSFAFLVLAVWPLVMLVLFKRRAMPEAIILSIMGAYFWLPAKTGFNLPAVRTLDKETLTAWAVIPLIMLALAEARRRKRSLRPALVNFPAPDSFAINPGIMPRGLILFSVTAVFLLRPIGTFLDNRNTIIIGDTVLPGLSMIDGLSALQYGVFIGLPYLIGRKYLGDPKAHVLFLRCFIVLFLLYLPLVAWELRFSPQLHRDIYGFYPQSFRQSVREGGFRPIVFMKHGLVLAIFAAFALVAAVGYWRIKAGEERLKWFAVIGVIGLTLTVMNSLGAFMLGLLFAAFAWFLTVRLQLVIASIIAIVLLSYPYIRANEAIPYDRVLELASGVDESRGSSLLTRLVNEEVLLEKGFQKPYFGWGGWGRGRIYSESGRDITISDGTWIITVGEGGMVSYFALFGLFCLPILLLTLRARRYQVSLATSTLCLILAVNLFDLIPNSSLTSVTFLLAGALAGRYELGAKFSEAVTQGAGHDEANGAVGVVRTRFPSTVTPRAETAKKTRYTRRSPANRVVRRKKPASPRSDV